MRKTLLAVAVALALAWPAVAQGPGPVPSPGGGTASATSLSAATAVGAGSALVFNAPRSTLSMQVSFTGTPTSVTVQLLGSIDLTNYYALTTFSDGASGDIVWTIGAIPVLAVKANLVLLSGGTAPTVTAVIAGY